MSITLEQIITFLLEAPMFGDLNPTELSQIVHIMQVQRVRDGQYVFREGDPGDAWFVVYHGSVEVSKNQEFGPTQPIAQLGPRACFGEISLLDHAPRSATVVALGDTTLFKFPRASFETLLHEENLAAYKLIYEMARVLAQRARNTTQELSHALAEGEHERLHRTTRRLIEGHSVSE